LVQLFPFKGVHEDEVLLDTIVQVKKIITFPADVKLQKNIIEKCKKVVYNEGIDLRLTYKRELKQLMIDQRFHSHPRRKKKARSAARRIKVITGRIVRDIDRKMESGIKEKYKALFTIFNKVLAQEKSIGDKIYNIHLPYARCFAKGKETKNIR